MEDECEQIAGCTFIQRSHTAESALLMLAPLILGLVPLFAGRRVRSVMKDGEGSMAECKAQGPG